VPVPLLIRVGLLAAGLPGGDRASVVRMLAAVERARDEGWGGGLTALALAELVDWGAVYGHLLRACHLPPDRANNLTLGQLALCLEASLPKPPPDGPEPGSTLRWKGIAHDLSPLHWGLARFFWARDAAPVEEVVAAVWGGSEPADATIRAELSRLNSRLLGIGVPWSLCYRAGHIRRS
jgi:hypothetical protein